MLRINIVDILIYVGSLIDSRLIITFAYTWLENRIKVYREWKIWRLKREVLLHITIAHDFGTLCTCARYTWPADIRRVGRSTGTTSNLITRNCARDATRCDEVYTIGTINVVERPLARDYGWLYYTTATCNAGRTIAGIIGRRRSFVVLVV